MHDWKPKGLLTLELILCLRDSSSHFSFSTVTIKSWAETWKQINEKILWNTQIHTFNTSCRFQKKAADKIFIHVLFTFPFRMYKTLLCSTVGFCTRIQQIIAKGLVIQRQHVFTTIEMLKVWIDTLCVKPACCQNVNVFWASRNSPF